MHAELSFPFAEPPPEGEPLAVAEGIYWLRLPLPFALDHINVWLLADGEGWTLVDTGIGRPEVWALWQQLFETGLRGRPLRRVVVTHYHPDHIGQAAALSEHFAAPVLMSAGELGLASDLHQCDDAEAGGRLADLYRRHGLDAATANAIEGNGNAYRRMVPTLPSGVETVAEGETLTIGERQWRLITCGGHAPEHVCLFAEGEDGPLLISGDQVLPRISTNVSARPGGSADPLAEYLDSLQRLGALPAATRVLPSHGRVFEGLRERCAALAEHHDQQLDKLREAAGEPISAADLLQLMFQRPLDTHATLFAMGESIAHLEHLVARGELERLDGHPIRYRRVH